MLILSGCTSNVTNKDVTIKVGEENLTGKYTGTLTDGEPNGEGEFVFESNQRTYEYKGGWKAGEISGKGTLKDTKYIVNFSDVDRVGEYSGEVLNGVAHGQGMFVAINDSDEKYTYNGSWENGLWNGYGQQKFENEDIFTKTGNFKDGEFAPSKLEFIQSVGTSKQMEFVPTDKAIQFVKEHENFFPANSVEDITPYVDATITYKNLIKKPENFGDKIIQLRQYEILQIWEENEYGYTITYFLAQSPNYDDFIYVYYLGELPDVYEGSVVNIYGLPISNSSFENIGGGTTLCYVVYGCKIN